jgi:hypothetical protein
MVEIKPYSEGSIPNLAVGTPGINNAPGETFRSLAKDIGDVRQQIGQSKLTKLNAILEPFTKQAPYLGSAIGGEITRHLNDVAHKAAQQATLQADQGAEEGNSQYASVAYQKRMDLQSKNADNPAQAVADLKDYHEQARDLTLGMFDQQYNDAKGNSTQLAARNKLEAGIDASALSENKAAYSWMQGKQHAQSQAFVEGVPLKAAAEISSMTGTPEEMLKQGSDIMAIASNALKGSATALPVEALKAAQQVRGLPVTLGQKLLESAPRVPYDATPEEKTKVMEGRVAYARNIGNAIANDELGPMDATAKIGLLDSASVDMRQYGTELGQHLKHMNLHEDNEVAKLHSEIKVNAGSDRYQQGAQLHILSAIKNVETDVAGKLADKSIPEEVQNQYIANRDARISNLRTAYGEATTNRNAIATAAKQARHEAEMEARREQSDARREQRLQDRSMNAVKQMELFADTRQIADLNQNPEANADQIKALHGSVEKKALAAQAAGVLTPAQANHFIKGASTAAVNKAQKKAAILSADGEAYHIITQMKGYADIDAIQNMGSIVELGQHLTRQVTQAEAKGLINPRRAASLKDAALAISDQGNSVVWDVPQTFGRYPMVNQENHMAAGPFDMHIPVHPAILNMFGQKKANFDQAQKQRSAAAAKITGIINGLMNDQQARNNNYELGFTPDMQDRYDGLAQIARDSAKAQKWTPIELQIQLQKAQNMVLEDGHPSAVRSIPEGYEVYKGRGVVSGGQNPIDVVRQHVIPGAEHQDGHGEEHNPVVDTVDVVRKTFTGGK